MPMATTLVSGLPVMPTHSPLRTLSAAGVALSRHYLGVIEALGTVQALLRHHSGIIHGSTGGSRREAYVGRERAGKKFFFR